MLRMLDLFAGIGGISLAAQWAGIETAAFCEIEPYCQKVLRRHWPTVPIYEDVRELTSERLQQDGVINHERTIDIISGGYPCQPFSIAGNRRGARDDRHLWPEMFRLVQELRPTWVIGENVAGHVSLGLDAVLSDLEGEGYTCRAIILPAAAVGAPHRRERVFIVAHAGSSGRYSGRNHWERRQICNDREWLPSKSNETGSKRICGSSEVGNDVCKSLANSYLTGLERRTETRNPKSEGTGRKKHFERCNKLQRRGSGTTEPRLGGTFDGVSSWLDEYRWPAAFGQPQYEWEAPRLTRGGKHRKERLRALGNAVVPQQIYPIMKAIREIEGETEK